MGKNEFVFKRCGKCCVHAIPQFEEDEYIRVRNIALQKGITFIRRNHEDGPIYFTSKTYARVIACLQGKGELINGEPVFRCEFLEYDKDGTASCSIYEFRPQVCRVFGLNPRDITKRCLNL